jgi:hypothetical protein
VKTQHHQQTLLIKGRGVLITRAMEGPDRPEGLALDVSTSRRPLILKR